MSPIATQPKPQVVTAARTGEDLLKGADNYYKILANSGFGKGKSYFGFTFPDIAYIATESHGLSTYRSNPQLHGNLKWYEMFIPRPLVKNEAGQVINKVSEKGEIISETLKHYFNRLDKAIERAHTDFAAGKIKTLFLDNITYLVENRWWYICLYEPILTKTGQLDTRSMYGELGRWAYQWTIRSIVSFPGHVVVSVHEMREDDEEMSRRVDPTVPIVPNILGSFRTKVAGMFGASIFLDCKKATGKDGKPFYRYYARCRKGDQRDAKNNYALPEVVDNINFKTLDNAIKGVVSAKQ